MANTFPRVEAILRFLGEGPRTPPDEVAGSHEPPTTFDQNARSTKPVAPMAAKYGKALRPTDPDDPNSFKDAKKPRSVAIEMS